MHWCRRCSFNEATLTSVTVLSRLVLSDIVTQIIIIIITIPLCSFSPNQCGLVVDKKNHHHSHKTAPIYMQVWGRGSTKKKAKSHTELHYSRKPCWYDFVDSTISGTFLWNNWSHVQCAQLQQTFKFLLYKYSLLKSIISIFPFENISKLALKHHHGRSILTANFRQKCLH